MPGLQRWMVSAGCLQGAFAAGWAAGERWDHSKRRPSPGQKSGVVCNAAPMSSVGFGPGAGILARLRGLKTLPQIFKIFF